MFQKALRQRTQEIGRNIVPISMTGTLENLLITVTGVALEKISFSDTQNPNSVC